MLDRFQSIDPRLLDLRCGDRVLDLGCGTGRHVLELCRQPLNIVGTDISAPDILKGRFLLELMRRKGEVGGRVHWAYSHGERLPFKDSAFDKVICTETLEHVPDDAALVRELMRVLKPGGILAVSVPDEYSERVLWKLSVKYVTAVGGHIRIYRRRDVVNLLRNGGAAPYAIRYRHGLESIYWMIHVLSFDDWGQLGPVTGALRKFLDSPKTRASKLITALDDVVNRMFPKSIVVYSRKPLAALDHDADERAATAPPRTFEDEARDILRHDMETARRRALESLRSARFSFISAVESMTEEQASAPGPNGLSVKEIVSHVAGWDEWTALGLREIAGGATWPGMLRLEGHPDGPFTSVNEFNERCFARGRDESWQDALERSRAAFGQLVEAAEAVTGADLALTEPFEWRDLGVTLPAGLFLLLEDARHYAEEHASDMPKPAPPRGAAIP